MSVGDRYRALAADLDARALKEADRLMRSEWEAMARCYRSMAAQSDRPTGLVIDINLSDPPTH